MSSAASVGIMVRGSGYVIEVQVGQTPISPITVAAALVNALKSAGLSANEIGVTAAVRTTECPRLVDQILSAEDWPRPSGRERSVRVGGPAVHHRPPQRRHRGYSV